VAGAGPLAALLLGCATDLLVIHEEGGEAVYRHRKLGYAITAPDRKEAGHWVRRQVKGAALAFRERDPATGSTMSMLTRCGGPQASPMILARHLTIGLRDRDFRQSGPVAVDGIGGWVQIFDTRIEEIPVRVKTVTVHTLGCTFDWVLVSRDSFSRYEVAFDSWWASFRSGVADQDSGETLVVVPGAPSEERSEGPADPEPKAERVIE
jgi:hypothetical protein